MRMRKMGGGEGRAVSVVAVGVAGMLLSGAAAFGAIDYSAVAVPNLNGGTGTIASGVNSAGVVVGQADDEFGALVAFVFENGTTTALPALSPGQEASATSVNTAGVVVGFARDGAGVQRAVKWQKVAGAWTITDLGTLDAQNRGLGYATRINDAGAIVGYATVNVPGSYHACIWNPGAAGPADLGTLGFSGNFAYSQALGINNNGWVTGFAYAVLQGPEHGLSIAPGGRPEDVTPEGQFGLAQWHNVTDGGTLAGYVSGLPGTNGFTPATYFGGQGYTLIPLLSGLPEGYAFDINNANVTVGTMFLLDPDPNLSIFRAFKFERGATIDLNTVASGLPGTLTEAKDIADSGHIVATAAGPGGPMAVLLAPIPPCAADFNGVGGVTVQDIFDFLTAWFSSDPRGDFNGQGGISVQDIFDFLSAWFTGC